MCQTVKKGIQRHREVSMPERIYYISSEDLPLEYVSQEGSEDTVFTKAIRKRLVIEAQALLRSSIMAIFYRLGLTAETLKQNLASKSQEMKKIKEQRQLLDGRGV